MKTAIINNKGFTLIELITAMAILALLGGSLYTLLYSGNKTFEAAHDSYKTQNEVRIAMSYISVKIRQNDSLTPSGGHNVDVANETSGTALAINSENLKIYELDGKLRETAGDAFSSTGTVIADGLEDVSFTTSSALSTDSMCIGITIKYKDSRSAIGKTLNETITLRAGP